ncbi:terminase small subunit [Allocoleopsis sp.]|uniref:terminase small subunit n=1 Tax=Allocoleopsis sp. TaxID=3088169 RepID=UPI002FCEB554
MRSRRVPKTPRGLSEDEEKFVAALTDGGNHTQACKVANISRGTGYKFLGRPHVQDAIASRLRAREETSIQVKEEFRATRTRVIFTEIDEKLKNAAVDAVDTIIDIMKNGKRDVDKLAACDRVIKLAGITESQTKTIAHGSERMTSQRGLSEEMADSIRKRILGIVEEPKAEEPQPVTVEAPVEEVVEVPIDN